MTNAELPKYLLFDGDLVPYEDAKIHVLSTSLKYGVGVFEGFRAYWSEEQQELYGFRLEDHFRRLVDSLRISGMEADYEPSALAGELIGLIRANDLRQNLHMRVQAFVASEDGTPEASGPVLITMAAIPMGNYFGKPVLDVCVSSWTRIDDRAMPPRVKAIGNYQNSRLAMMESRANGYKGALLLTAAGLVSEGPGYNVFVVKNGRIATPRVTDGILEGITRATLIQLADADLGLAVEERAIDRTELYVADEVFVCGSAAEVSSVVSVDRKAVGDGEPGPVTTALQDAYRATTLNQRHAERGWAWPVYGEVAGHDSGVEPRAVGATSQGSVTDDSA